jgi:hypothetical protein
MERATSSWPAKASCSSRSYRSAQRWTPVVVSMTCAEMRRRPPLRRTVLPARSVRPAHAQPGGYRPQAFFPTTDVVRRGAQGEISGLPIAHAIKSKQPDVPPTWPARRDKLATSLPRRAFERSWIQLTKTILGVNLWSGLPGLVGANSVLFCPRYLSRRPRVVAVPVPPRSERGAPPPSWHILSIVQPMVWGLTILFLNLAMICRSRSCQPINVLTLSTFAPLREKIASEE